MSIGKKDQLLKSLEYFKDWSNYLLVTTVAAMGWVSASGLVLDPKFIQPVLWCLALSIVFGIFTLALIPIVGETLTDDTESIYDVRGSFRLFWMTGPKLSWPLKYVCWWQHILFILAILLYAYGTNARG
jgi:hypothetical protein